MLTKLHRYGSLLVVLLLLQTAAATAQVKGVSYTLAPSANYTWFDNTSGIGDGLMVGARVGFGFGQNVELRGIYSQSVDLQNDLENLGLDDDIDPDDFTFRNVDITRYGGELKLNLGQSNFFPHLLLGTGVQNIELDGGNENSNIFASLGLGLTLSAADRFTFNVEGKNLLYNFNAARNLLTTDDQGTLGVDINQTAADRLNNWMVGANIAFYLGGVNPGELTDVDLAYRDAFNNGLSGLSLIVEPTLSRINWDDGVAYRDTWLGGVNAGFDFGPLVGVRGFYLKGMQDDEISLDFDDINVFGGDFRFKLNSVTTGLTPYLSVGGGYIDVKNNYIGANGLPGQEDQAFATGGGGLVLGFGRNLRVRGGVNALLTTREEVDDRVTTDEIATNLQYSVGLDFVIGKKAERPDAVFQSEYERALAQERAKSAQETKALRQSYESRVDSLNREIDRAYQTADVEKAADLLEERDDTEAVVAELRSREAEETKEQAEALQRARQGQSGNTTVVAGNANQSAAQREQQQAQESRLVMTPEQFEEVIERVMRNTTLPPGYNPGMEQQGYFDNQGRYVPGPSFNLRNNNNNNGQSGNNAMSADPETQEMRDRMDRMERLLQRMDARERNDSLLLEQLDVEEERRKLSPNEQQIERDARILKELRQIRDEMKTMRRDIGDNEVNMDVIVDERGRSTFNGTNNIGTMRNGRPNIIREGNYLRQDTSSFQGKVRYTGLSGFGSFTFTGDATAGLGLRWHYNTGVGTLQFMPEAFFGFGDPNSFGVVANVVQPFNLGNFNAIRPYIGAGFGFQQLPDEEEANTSLGGGINLLAGTYLNVANGRVYVEYNGRELFDHQQVLAGYRFSF